MTSSRSTVETRAALVYPTAQPPEGPYPEQAIPRYSAAAGLWGACFSGGGPRSFAASLGQMRGLHAAGVLPLFGAISCVSGGSWFGGPFSFAPTTLDDELLLGPVIAPRDIKVDELDHIAGQCLGAALLALTDLRLAALYLYYAAEWSIGNLPYDKIWARILNETVLEPFDLDDTGTLFTLDEDTLSAIRGRNPGFAVPFYTLRPGRPFFVAGGTHIYPLGLLELRRDSGRARPARSRATRVARPDRSVANLPGEIYRHFEYTPGYAGTPQLFTDAGIGGADFGNGYVESFAFDTPTPLGVSNRNVAKVPAGRYPFLLSDVIGSSSAALASVLDEFGFSGGFPFFDYWPIKEIGQEPAATYSFGDGGILENTGIVPLLRRGYRVIFAFVNTPFPVNSDDPGCVNGIDGQISRLFGFIPADDYGNNQNTQIFASDQFAVLATRLKAARAAGAPVVYADHYPILPSNPFELAPYRPLIFWLYNDWNMAWYTQLPLDVKNLFTSWNPFDYLGNFPNYATVGQNDGELLYLTPRQINLLAHMWCFTVLQGFQTSGKAFDVDLPAD
jgi:hypothetical protein